MNLSQKNEPLFIIMVTHYYLKICKTYEKYGIAYYFGNSLNFPGILIFFPEDLFGICKHQFRILFVRLWFICSIVQNQILL
jgi:hypothetical protein